MYKQTKVSLRASLVDPTKQRRINVIIQNYSKSHKRECSPTPWVQYHPEMWRKQRCHRNYKPESLMNGTTKHLQQNASKWDLAPYKKNYKPWLTGVYPRMQGWFNIWKSINVIHHISKARSKTTRSPHFMIKNKQSPD